jgi:hypothetical protein
MALVLGGEVTDTPGWTTIGSFGTGLEADMARERLITAGIPVLMRTERSGIFGPGFQGAMPGGAGLAVPAAFADQARALLDSGAG